MISQIDQHIKREARVSTDHPSYVPPPRRKAASGQAEILDNEQAQRVLEFIRTTSSAPEADELKFLLSYRAGLRVGEIAAIEVRALITGDGRVASVIEIRSEWSKSKQARSIPMHPDIRDAVRRFRGRFPDATHVGITVVAERVRRQSANATCRWFIRLYAAVGLSGYSSHSGRRSFITALARRANSFHTSLRDVQILAGHARLDTTERYIEPSKDLALLVQSLGEDCA